MLAASASSAAGGFLLALAFPPAGWDFTAWIALIPLFQVLQSEDRLGLAFSYGGIFGIAFFVVDVNWIYETLITHGHFARLSAVMVFVGMILSLALFSAVFGLGLACFSKKGLKIAVMAPFLWTGLEYIRTTIFTGFPWDLIGYSQSGRLLLVQLSDVTGVYGISFLVVLVNAGLWELMRASIAKNRVPWFFSATCGIALVTSIAYGYVRLQAFPAEVQDKNHFILSILQGNIPQEIKWEETARQHTFQTYEDLGRIAVQEGAKLLVWPETSVPVLFGDSDSEWRRTAVISQDLHVPMLVGAPSYRSKGGRTEYYNSAFLVDGSSLRYRYDKIHLVPFGEYMPLTWLLPLGPGIAAREADYSPGDKMTVMRIQGCPPFSVLICYEAIFPDLARLAVRNGARMLINITNDGWFRDTGAPYQHLAMSGFRSVENRVPLVRAANTGISAAFDPAGRLLGRIPLQEKGVLTVQVPSSTGADSFYGSFGDVFAWSCLGICFITGISGWAKTYKVRNVVRLH
ncbi:MAG: apolipoprotein N-acyltransferase [Desulfomonile sp.]